MESNCIFATHYDFLNDLREGRAIEELLASIFEKQLRVLIPKLVKEGLLPSKIYEEHGKSIYELEAKKLVSIMVTVTNDTTPIFVVSFCKHDQNSREFDHGLLSQWRGYGGEGGFAIEFDENGIDELIHTESKKPLYTGIKSDVVSYKNYERLFDSKKFEGVATETIRAAFEAKGVDISIFAKKKDFNEVYEPFVATLPFLKDSSFEEEREYRIVAAVARPSLLKEPKNAGGEIEFQKRGNMVTPYVKLFRGIDRKLPIKSIIVGPHRFQEKQKYAVMLACERFELKPAVKISTVPFIV
jgi:hypothetical protein